MEKTEKPNLFGTIMEAMKKLFSNIKDKIVGAGKALYTVFVGDGKDDFEKAGEDVLKNFTANFKKENPTVEIDPNAAKEVLEGLKAVGAVEATKGTTANKFSIPVVSTPVPAGKQGIKATNVEEGREIE